MKTLKLFFLIFALAVLTFGCKKDQKKITELPNPNPTATSMNELIVSADFDWKLSKEVGFTISGEKNGMVIITSEDEKVIYHKGFKHDESKYYVKIDIPKYVNQVKVNGVLTDIGSKSLNLVVGKDINLINAGTSLKNGEKSKGESLGFSSPVIFNPAATGGGTGTASLDDSHFVTVFTDEGNGSYGTAVVGTISGNTITYGPEYVFNSGTTHNSLVNILDPTHIVICYKDLSNSTYGTAVVGTISGNSITYGSEYVFNSGHTETLAAALVDANTFVVIYRDDWNGRKGTAVIGTVAGNVITFGSEYVYENIKSDMHYVTSPSLGKFIVAYTQNYYVTGHGVALVGNISGTTISFGSKYTYNPASTIGSCINMMETNKFVIAYCDDGNGRYGTAIVGSISGNTLSFGSEFVYKSTTTLMQYFTPMDSERFITSYAYNSNQTHASVIGIVSGNNISFSSEYVFHVATVYCGYKFMESINSTQFIITITDGGNSNYGTSYLGTLIIDSDDDGIPDGEDDYPLDPLRAFDNYFPATGYGTLAFEDIWTHTGDYDFNDLVMDYRFQTVTNASNEVVEVFGNFVTKALGAGNNNSFGFNLPNANGTLINNLTVTGSDIVGSLVNLNGNGLETGQTHPTIIVYDQSLNFTNLVNTLRNSWYSTPVTTTITMVPSATYTQADFALSTFNPFIIIAQTRGRELHLPDYEPTDLIDITYYGTYLDATDPGSGIYFKTANNLPWGINIPESFAYPFEYADITTAFTHFQAWAESSGVNYSDWYQDNPGYRNNTNIYTHP